MARDPRAEPRYAERVPYVVINGPPGARLVDLVVSPEDLINSNANLTINYQYYIHKQVRELRIFVAWKKTTVRTTNANTRLYRSR